MADFKAWIVKQPPSFYNENERVLHLQVADNYYFIAKEVLKGKKPGDVLRVKLGDWEVSPTEQQNNFFHKLLQLFIQSGMASTDNYDALKKYIKERYGVAPTEEYVFGKKEECLKSWRDYTKEERKQTISGLIALMMELGVQTKNPEFDSIILQFGGA